MKTSLVLSAMLLLLVSGCRQKQQTSGNQTLSAEEPVWKQQMDHLIDKANVTKFAIGLSLIAYADRGTISCDEEIEEVLDALFDDNSYHVIFAGTPECAVWSLSAYKSYLAGTAAPDAGVTTLSDRIDSVAFQKKTSLRPHLKIGMKVFELYWNYKGINFSSLALASDEKGVEYDNIGTFMVNQIETDKQNQRLAWEVSSHMYPVVLTKTWTELPLPDLCHFVWKTQNANIFGQIVYEVTIGCRSVFSDNGRFTDAQFFVDSYASPGWFCTADIHTLQGTPWMSTSHQFVWNCLVGVSPLHDGIPNTHQLGESLFVYGDTLCHNLLASDREMNDRKR